MDCFKNDKKRIDEFNTYKTQIICCKGPTEPTGPTERLFKSSNRIIIDSS